MIQYRVHVRLLTALCISKGSPPDREMREARRVRVLLLQVGAVLVLALCQRGVLIAMLQNDAVCIVVLIKLCICA